MNLLYLTFVFQFAAAFPPGALDILARYQREVKLAKRADNATQAASQAESNCGPTPCTTFSATEQYVSTSGQHAYTSPAASQIRGPCPGLNAAANHGYLPRSGIANIQQTIEGLGELYAMSSEVAGFLATYAVIMDGDPLTQTWSIGGPMDTLLTPLGYTPQGISYSHNKYEGDTSIGRQDAYLNNGDAHSLDISRFTYTFSSGVDDDRYTLDKFRQVSAHWQQYSVGNNPYYFAPLFSTTVVAGAAYNFVINFMSNHSAEEPSGYLNGDIFKSFFGVTGDYPNLAWQRGQERIPDGWYRRPSANAYSAQDVIGDLVIGWAAYPDTFRLGGNTNGVNSYVGVDVPTLTSGAYSLQNLFEGDNFACLFFQIQEQAVPDELKGLVNVVAEAMALFNTYVAPLTSQFSCSQLAKYDDSVFNAYPGRTYSPTGPDNNY